MHWTIANAKNRAGQQVKPCTGKNATTAVTRAALPRGMGASLRRAIKSFSSSDFRSPTLLSTSVQEKLSLRAMVSSRRASTSFFCLDEEVTDEDGWLSTEGLGIACRIRSSKSASSFCRDCSIFSASSVLWCALQPTQRHAWLWTPWALTVRPAQ